jgi:hypothetical protein
MEDIPYGSYLPLQLKKNLVFKYLIESKVCTFCHIPTYHCKI